MQNEGGDGFSHYDVTVSKGGAQPMTDDSVEQVRICLINHFFKSDSKRNTFFKDSNYKISQKIKFILFCKPLILIFQQTPKHHTVKSHIKHLKGLDANTDYDVTITPVFHGSLRGKPLNVHFTTSLKLF